MPGNPNPAFISHQVHDSDYFFADLRPDPRREFVLVGGGLEYCDQNYLIERGAFAFYTIEYVLTGECEVTLDGRCFALHAGSVFGYAPHIRHRIRNTNAENPLAKYFVSFAGASAPGLFAEVFKAPPRPRQITNLRTMAALFRQLLECGQRGGHHLQRIGHLLVELIAVETLANTVSLQVHHSQSHLTFQRCRTYLEHHYRSIQSVAELAKACHVSSGYLSRIFKKYTGESPYDAIIRLRLNRSAELLQKRDVLVKEAAQDIGFQDPYHFSRVFKRHFGISPQKFRQKMQRY